MDWLHWALIALLLSLYSGSVLALIDEGAKGTKPLWMPLFAVLTILVLPGIILTLLIRKWWLRSIPKPISDLPMLNRMYLASTLFIGKNTAISLLRFKPKGEE
jgi:hypothetical protein